MSVDSLLAIITYFAVEFILYGNGEQRWEFRWDWVLFSNAIDNFV